MEIHCAFGGDMDNFIRECARLFHDKRSRDHLFLSFCIHIFKQHVSIVFQHALASTIKKRKLCWQVMHVLNIPLLLSLTICMQVTLKGPWVR
jgi:hypothetical protein